jgi:iron complex outermembrane receptor protein
MEANPRSARPATAVLPGAEQQNASVRNRTFFGGVTNEIKMRGGFKNVFSIFGSQTLFENPFITNYEVRDETNAGARTWFQYKNNEDSWIPATLQAGAEYQEMQSVISNYGNRSGVRDSVQAIDNVNTRQAFVFGRGYFAFRKKTTVDAALSYNFNSLDFDRTAPVLSSGRRTFTPQLMPRVALLYKLRERLALRAILSRGYSPPTLQEVRSSDLRVNETLGPESGWNYEAGIRTSTKDNRISLDAAVFYYRLNRAIIRNVNASGQEYFENTGATDQPGFESSVYVQLLKGQRENKFFRAVTLGNSNTIYAFTFSSTRKSLTGVPSTVEITSLRFQFPRSVYCFIQHNHTSALPLNDANTTWSKAYDLLMVKAGWVILRNNHIFDLSAGVDNLLDVKYSLGNDLNAVGARYYNPAAGRNYFVRLSYTR